MQATSSLRFLALPVFAVLLAALSLLPNARTASAIGPIAIDGAGFHTCVVTAVGDVQCWGQNNHGQLGNVPPPVSGLPNSYLPVAVCADAACETDLTGASGIAVGTRHSCALMQAGTVKCWGDNDSDQLGDGTTTDSTTPVDVCADASCTGPLSGVASISAGYLHTCALLTGGGVKCWGNNGAGQLGDGTMASRSNPVDVTGLGGVAAIAAGGFLSDGHTCALLDDDTVRCWGGNEFGQLGDGTTTDSTTPVAVCDDAACTGGLANIAQISTELVHTCALTLSGDAKCWGVNSFEQLGAPTVEMCSGAPCSSTPLDVQGIGTTADAVTAAGSHTCVLTTAAGVKCWGANPGGQLGDGQVCGTNTCTAPVDVVGLGSGVDEVNAGSNHTCAVETGAIRCWGSNSFGGLGDGSAVERTIPTDVVGFGPATGGYVSDSHGFIDISASGVQQGAPSDCDDCVQGTPIGFDFNFYGMDFSSVWVSSNGNLQFESQLPTAANSTLPAAGFGRTIFAWWDDLTTENASCPGSSVAAQTLGSAPNRIFVVQWNDVCHTTGPTASVTFEVMLFETSNEIFVLYDDTDFEGVVGFDAGGSATVGLQQNGSTAVPFLFNTPALRDRLAVPFRPDGAGSYTFNIAATGTQLVTASDCDDCTEATSIGFTFDFYTASYNSVTVSSNGNLQFDTSSAANGNTALPATGFSHAIFPWWDDLDTTDPGCVSRVYAQTLGSSPGRIFVVRWINACHAAGPTKGVTFEAALYESSNKIRFLYQDTDFDGSFFADGGASATVGIQRNDAGPALQYSQDAPFLRDGQLVTIARDSDDDKVPDKLDACPSGTGTVDTDGDGICNNLDLDDDSDGCTDAQEQGPDPTAGGQRNPKFFWDFFDTPDAAGARDTIIATNDIFRVVQRFGTFHGPPLSKEAAYAEALGVPPATGYHAAFDRSPPQAGGDPWALGPPDGSIAANDILFVVNQFGHTCA